jgi:hypothetical protein
MEIRILRRLPKPRHLDHRADFNRDIFVAQTVSVNRFADPVGKCGALVIFVTLSASAANRIISRTNGRLIASARYGAVACAFRAVVSSVIA